MINDNQTYIHVGSVRENGLRLDSKIAAAVHSEAWQLIGHLVVGHEHYLVRGTIVPNISTLHGLYQAWVGEKGNKLKGPLL